MREPVLAARTIPRGWRASNGRQLNDTLRVLGGLDYIRGNQSPHFSLTMERRPKGSGHINSCGCDHETILKYYPQFADLAALHLSDIDGVPMHAEANGWYDLAGALPEHGGQQYHAGNSQRNFPKPDGAPRRGEWDNTEYRNPTPDECLQIFADHVRCDLDTAREVARMVEVAATRYDNGEPLYEWNRGRARFKEWIKAQRPRWKAEAEACIARHGLKVYGDQWPPVA